MNPFKALQNYIRPTFYRTTLCISVCVGGAYVFYKVFKKSKTAHLENGPSLADNALGLISLILADESVFLRDPIQAKELLQRIVVDGPDCLQIIADFDRTLTPLTFNGDSMPSSHNVLESSPPLSPEIFSAINDVRDHYFPIELNPLLTQEEKTPLMEEWYSTAHSLLVEAGITRNDISRCVAQVKLRFRTGVDKAIEALGRRGVPFLIFSAGLGDVIEEFLRLKYRVYDNVKIISNWMDFNHQGAIVGFKSDTVHMFNKNAHALDNSHYFEENHSRTNVVLLGDSTGDANMAEGVPNLRNLVKIGFLNHHVEENLPKYMELYDIVLTGDPSAALLEALSEAVCY